MKSTILFIFLFISVFFSAQYNDEVNRFNHQQQVEKDNVFKGHTTGDYHENLNNSPDLSHRPGAPGEPASIDDPLIYLLLAALGIICWVTYKKSSVRLR